MNRQKAHWLLTGESTGDLLKYFCDINAISVLAE